MAKVCVGPFGSTCDRDQVVRVVSVDKHFKDPANFKRIFKKDAEIVRLVLAKAGIALDPNANEKKQLEAFAAQHKVADITITAGQQTSQVASTLPLVEPMPGQPTANLVGGGDTPVQLGLQQAYGWTFQADPKITISYTYQ